MFISRTLLVEVAKGQRNIALQNELPYYQQGISLQLSSNHDNWSNRLGSKLYNLMP